MRAQSSSLAKRPLVATATGNKMIHTMSSGIYFPNKAAGSADLICE